MPTSLKAGTLAVGTEITDGQIIDRNSAWISQKLVQAGINVIEHRSVADDRAEIDFALRSLAARVDVLFVTGGLGPTSDDFTRDIVASTFGKQLKFDQESWQRIEERFRARGAEARPIQRQQCFFPEGSRILINPVGTADAFSMQVKDPSSSRMISVYAMPGPPIEVAVVWEMHLNQDIEKLVPESDREKILILRTLGRGESEIAELTEEIIRGTLVKVGYRAHLPYVEVKLWFKERERERVQPILDKVEATLAPYLINRNDEDLADDLIKIVDAGMGLFIRDRATAGFLQERVNERLRLRQQTKVKMGGALTIETQLLAWPLRTTEAEVQGFGVYAEISADENAGLWRVKLKTPQGGDQKLEVMPTPLYNLSSDRGRRFLVEQTLLLLKKHLKI
jgi:nicotinamide-nucleotide amidase